MVTEMGPSEDRERGQVPEDPTSPKAECRVRWCLAHIGQMGKLKPKEET